jgi:hypothetical protein
LASNANNSDWYQKAYLALTEAGALAEAPVSGDKSEIVDPKNLTEKKE